MSSRKGTPALPRCDHSDAAYSALKRSDLAVWTYLDDLTQGGDTCTASIPKIAGVCKISERQVQISVGRLINSGVIKRIGYDFGNSVREKRGTVFKIIKRSTQRPDVR